MRAAIAGLAGYVPAAAGGGGTTTPPETVTFTPVPGSYYEVDNNYVGSAGITISASSSVKWNWTANSTAGLTSRPINGTVSDNITLTLLGGLQGRTTTITLTAVVNGITYTWTITLSATPQTSGGAE